MSDEEVQQTSQPEEDPFGPPKPEPWKPMQEEPQGEKPNLPPTPEPLKASWDDPANKPAPPPAHDQVSTEVPESGAGTGEESQPTHE
jgi:hypothetical protein